jgi:hypothetical protein
MRTNCVNGPKASLGEEGGPLVLPALVDMPRTALMGYSGREEYDRRQSDEFVHERIAHIYRKVLRDLEAEGQVEAPVYRYSSAEVGRDKVVGGNEEPLSIDIIAIGTDDIVDALASECRCPRREPTADINDAARVHESHDKRDNSLGSLEGASTLLVEEVVVVCSHRLYVYM